MIAMLIHPGRFTINLQSQGNRQTQSQRVRERQASCLLFVFSAFSNAQQPSIMVFLLLEAAAWCLSKEADFQSITWASNGLKTCAEMQVTLHNFSAFSAVNNSWKKVSSFSQSLPGVCERFERAIEWFFHTCLNPPRTDAQTHSRTHTVTLSAVITIRWKKQHRYVALFHLGFS